MKKTKKSLKKLIQTLTLAGLVAISPLANAKEATKVHKPSAVAVRIQNQKTEPINRLDIGGKLPFNMDYFATVEEQGDTDFYKVRLQYAPLNYRSLGLGATLQHKNSNKFSEKNDYGLVARLQGKPTQTTFGKLDMRYFANNNEVDWYGLINSKHLFIDCPGTYNTKTDKVVLRPGADAKIGDSFSLGLEGKFAGKASDIESKYVGLRAKLRF